MSMFVMLLVFRNDFGFLLDDFVFIDFDIDFVLLILVNRSGLRMRAMVRRTWHGRRWGGRRRRRAAVMGRRGWRWRRALARRWRRWRFALVGRWRRRRLAVLLWRRRLRFTLMRRRWWRLAEMRGRWFARITFEQVADSMGNSDSNVLDASD